MNVHHRKYNIHNKIPNINHVKTVEHASQDFKQECTSHDIQHTSHDIQHTRFMQSYIAKFRLYIIRY